MAMAAAASTSSTTHHMPLLHGHTATHAAHRAAAAAHPALSSPTSSSSPSSSPALQRQLARLSAPPARIAASLSQQQQQQQHSWLPCPHPASTPGSTASAPAAAAATPGDLAGGPLALAAAASAAATAAGAAQATAKAPSKEGKRVQGKQQQEQQVEWNGTSIVGSSSSSADGVSNSKGKKSVQKQSKTQEISSNGAPPPQTSTPPPPPAAAAAAAAGDTAGKVQRAAADVTPNSLDVPPPPDALRPEPGWAPAPWMEGAASAAAVGFRGVGLIERLMGGATPSASAAAAAAPLPAFAAAAAAGAPAGAPYADASGQQQQQQQTTPGGVTAAAAATGAAGSAAAAAAAAEASAAAPVAEAAIAGPYDRERLEQQRELVALVEQLEAIRLHALDLEQRNAHLYQSASVQYRESARNLLHYMALRNMDVRRLQNALSNLGLSSLGRTEAHTMASIQAVSRVLRSLLRELGIDLPEPNTNANAWPDAPTGPDASASTSSVVPTGAKQEWGPRVGELASHVLPPVMDFAVGDQLLQANTEELLGQPPARRKTHIMVTLPSEAADDRDLVLQLMRAGMDVARVNCAHDDAAVWARIIAHVRQCAVQLGQPCRVLMDLGGPKLRTGPLPKPSLLLKLKPAMQEDTHRHHHHHHHQHHNGHHLKQQQQQQQQHQASQGSKSRVSAPARVVLYAQPPLPLPQEGTNSPEYDAAAFAAADAKAAATAVAAAVSAASAAAAAAAAASTAAADFGATKQMGDAKAPQPLPLAVSPSVLRGMKEGSKLVFVDHRGKRRCLEVTRRVRVTPKRSSRGEGTGSAPAANGLPASAAAAAAAEEEPVVLVAECWSKAVISSFTPMTLVPPPPSKAGEQVQASSKGKKQKEQKQGKAETAASPVAARTDFTSTAAAGGAAAVEAAATAAGEQVPVSVGLLPGVEEPVLLSRGDRLEVILGEMEGRNAYLGPAVGNGVGDVGPLVLQPAQVSCCIPQVFHNVKAGEPIKLDDGKIEGVVEEVDADNGKLTVLITRVPPKGGKLKSEKAINLPDSDLQLQGLTGKDLQDLDFIAANADMVAFSFVNETHDVSMLQDELAKRGASNLGVVLKIETKRAFQNLPWLLLQGMKGRQALGVMIARGDMAVECGWERLAEVQEEILWLCEAAHVPTIWATQVLEGLAKEGLPSRAEITDAAMGERAECVMLNKGPHIVEAVKTLDDIMRRMRSHQMKKQSMLRPLHISRPFVVPSA